MPHLLIRIAERGRVIFGIVIAALGVEHLLCAQMATQPFPAQFHAVVIPVIPWIPAYPWLAYVTGALLIIAGLGMAMNVQARASALLVAGIMLGCNLVLHLPRMIVVPKNWGYRGEVCEMLAFAAAGLLLLATLPRADGSTRSWDGALAKTGRVMLGIAAVVFGVDHFLALKLIASLVPAWMPAHVVVASVTGATMIIAGLTILTNWKSGAGAFVLGAMYLMIFLTLHVARVLADPRSPDEWSSALIALGMCGVSWICAWAATTASPRTGMAATSDGRAKMSGAAAAMLGLLAAQPSTVLTHQWPDNSERTLVHDIVVLHGRVMNRASGLDAVRSLGITGGKIREISALPLQGRDTIDARGMVVAPGFIDLHQHAQDSSAYRVEALDGTTTALGLEDGTEDVERWYRERQGTSLINYGVSVGHGLIRIRVMRDSGDGVPMGPAKSKAASDSELKAILQQMDDGLRQGAIAVGLNIESTPAARPWEIVEMFRVAAAHRATVHVHLRALSEPSYFLETEEIIAAAAAMGASAHVVHIQSSGGEDTPRMLELIRGARLRHLDITAEVYPYTASMSEIEGAEFDDWESWKDSKFGRFEWPRTGE